MLMKVRANGDDGADDSDCNHDDSDDCGNFCFF